MGRCESGLFVAAYSAAALMGRRFESYPLRQICASATLWHKNNPTSEEDAPYMRVTNGKP